MNANSSTEEILLNSKCGRKIEWQGRTWKIIMIKRGRIHLVTDKLPSQSANLLFFIQAIESGRAILIDENL